MKNFLKTQLARFKNDDSGAVSVEWVVLTASVIGIGIGAITLVADSSEGVASASNEQLAGAMTDAAS